MAGEAIGALQHREVTAEMRCYERIESIEFIEDTQTVPNIRSLAYRPVQGGAQTRIRTGIQDDLVDSDLTVEQAQAYLERLNESGMFDWNFSYRPAQGTFVNAYTQWRLKVEFSAKEGEKAPKPYIVEGENVFPDNYENVVDILLCQDDANN